jgi:hypothetical protein
MTAVGTGGWPQQRVVRKEGERGVLETNPRGGDGREIREGGQLARERVRLPEEGVCWGIQAKLPSILRTYRRLPGGSEGHVDGGGLGVGNGWLTGSVSMQSFM